MPVKLKLAPPVVESVSDPFKTPAEEYQAVEKFGRAQGGIEAIRKATGSR